MRSAFVLVIIIGLSAVTSALASPRGVAIQRDGDELRLSASRMPFSAVVRALEPHLGRRVVVDAADRAVEFRSSGLTAEATLRRLVTVSGLELRTIDDRFVVRDPAEPRVMLDVKDRDVRAIFADIARQCGIRNLILDPDVTGRGTFLFHDVGCSNALRVVSRTFGLALSVEPNSIVDVRNER